MPVKVTVLPKEQETELRIDQLYAGDVFVFNPDGYDRPRVRLDSANISLADNRGDCDYLIPHTALSADDDTFGRVLLAQPHCGVRRLEMVQVVVREVE